MQHDGWLGENKRERVKMRDGGTARTKCKERTSDKSRRTGASI